ncbi:rab-GTPase-TBC domain-containing protein [Mycotypha africana]|uniref:rab-GTPase-TBC domain-containing protein n=1 Tax=Mycotypha africana TaxID=64632 RepID=UPI002301A1BA|nr:rab-GTPase-TBC domain-containing protein [Mycotypha africana]KAI8990953.1 rab-GTPase-TBC domain-containing protein [Mycotypha africana]
MEFGYPVNPKSSKEKSKVKLWKIYFQENGRNLTMIQLSTFGKLVRVGLPNLLRGEIWEVSSGAMYLRFANQGVYQEILAKYKDQKSTSTEEIEKDLNRSLPEYPGYQTSEGINRLRRVLTAYAWKNPELGYCQAMNIVVSALLIYTTEEQAFWILHVLVDRFCPGYYSTNMYGALLDQIVFEKLVQRTMPLLWEHFQKTNVELSVACLPWFLSLYINSMPLEYAVRVLDILFMEGPRIIFQIGLAILKANGDDLLKTTDDGGFLNVFKTFFQTIGDKEEYREFSLVTNEMVMELRNQNQLKVGASIESFTKRTAIRNLKDMASFSKDDIAILYDKYFTTLYYARKDSDNTSISKMNRAAFQSMLQSMTPWAKPSTSFPSEGHDSSHNADANAANNVCNSFIDRLFKQFLGNDSPDDLLDFQHMVKGMSDILHGDIMSHLDWYFDLYDTDKDGLLGSEDIVTMSKEMYWLISHLKDTDMAWDAVTNLIVNSHEQSDIARGGQPDENTLSHRLADLTMTTTPKRVEAEAVAGNGRMLWSFRDRTRQLENSMLADTVDLSLPSFRMVALTNESLEMFFDHEFANSFQLVKSTSEVPKSLGREVFENLFADGQKLATAVQNSNTSMSRSPFLSDTSSHKEKPTTPKSSEDSSSHVRQSEEMDADNALMDDWVHFDIWREKKTAQ